MEYHSSNSDKKSYSFFTLVSEPTTACPTDWSRSLNNVVPEKTRTVASQCWRVKRFQSGRVATDNCHSSRMV